jgi:diguanylate cyclase (GGDEF)-like protein
VRSWTVWRLPRSVRLLVLGTVASYVGLITTGFAVRPPSWHSLGTAIGFAGAAVLSIEVSMRLAWPRTRKDRLTRDFLGVWLLPVALLLPPTYVAVAILVPCTYIQLRAWRGDPIKVAYSIAALGLSYASASAVAGAVLSGRPLTGPSQLALDVRTATGFVLAGAAWWLVNHLLVALVVLLTGGRESLSSFVRDREGFVVDVVDVSVGMVAALLWAANPLSILLLVPPVLLMQHQLFSGLRQAVRTDLLTDVANPQFWRDVAGREVERAWASNANLAVLMIDIDHFKGVNDRYGHLAGDEVLAAVARTVSKALRPGDLVGRLGGEEFGATLTGLNLLDAEGAAERLRTQVAEIRVRSDRGEWISVTVSVGVAELSVTGGNLHDLLDAADTALYAAKTAGRNRVRAAGPRAGQVIDLRAVAQSTIALDAGTATSGTATGGTATSGDPTNASAFGEARISRTISSVDK